MEDFPVSTNSIKKCWFLYIYLVSSHLPYSMFFFLEFSRYTIMSLAKRKSFPVFVTYYLFVIFMKTSKITLNNNIGCYFLKCDFSALLL